MTNYKPKGITDPIKIYMYVQKLFNPAKTWERIEIQQIEFETVMSIDTTAENDPLRQLRLANITCYKCGQKDVIEKTTLVQLVQAQ